MSIGAAMIGSSVVGAIGSIFGSSSAASAQSAAAAKATKAQLKMFKEAQTALSPFISGGKTGMEALIGKLPYLSSDINLDQAALEATPGYKFTLSQGLKAVQNSAAARGLGASGAAIKGGAEYATGLSDATYNTRFTQEIDERKQILDALMSSINPGVAAGSSLASAATTTGAGVASNAIGAGNAQAANYINTGNQIGNVGNSLVSALLSKYLLPSPTPAAAG